MKFKIGVYGSAVKEKKPTREKAVKLGEELGNYDVIVITGACGGIPYLTASQVAKKGKEVWGFSPEINFEKQTKARLNDDMTIYSKLFYIPEDFPSAKQKEVAKKYRNVTSTATVDAAIIIAGRWGTMNEFTNLYDMGKVIGILTETGGIANELKNLTKKIKKPNNAKIFFNNNPQKLIKQILMELQKRNSGA